MEEHFKIKRDYLLNYLNRENILYVDNSPQQIIGKNSDLQNLRKILLKEHFSTIEDLINNKCITANYFDSLKNEIELTLRVDAASQFKSMLDTILRNLEHADDCFYIKPKEIDLRNFLEDLVEIHQEERRKSPGDYKRISEIFSSFFGDLPRYLEDTWSPNVIVDYIRGEVLEYYGLTCWEKTEMYLNELDPVERAKQDLSDWIEMLHGFCLEYS